MVALPKSERIRTPWKTRWRRFCYHVLPVIAFVVSVLVVGRMWLHQGAMPGGVGRVEALRVNITAGGDGRLVPLEELPGGAWKQFDTVQKGQIVARLDDRPLRAELQALRSEAAALQAELTATEVAARTSQFDRQQEHFREAAQLAYQVERYRLEVLQQQAQVEQARLELQRLDAQIDLMEKAYSTGVGIGGQSTSEQADRATLEKVLQTHAEALRQAKENLQAAQLRRSEFPDLPSGDVEVAIGPLRESIKAAEARIAALAAQINGLVIRAPIAGTISVVHAHPGQGVRTGDWIVTIAANKADAIIGYVPALHRFRPVEGMEVGVRLRVPGSRMVPSVVERVGSQWEPMPAELVPDAQTPQLALPVRIELPHGLNVRPGEVVDIRFFRRRSADIAQRSKPRRALASAEGTPSTTDEG